MNSKNIKKFFSNLFFHLAGFCGMFVIFGPILGLMFTLTSNIIRIGCISMYVCAFLIPVFGAIGAALCDD